MNKKHKKVRIGIMGGLICNENLGCVALTYSLMKMLEMIARENNYEFWYTIFEYEYQKEKYNQLAKFLSIDMSRIDFAPIGFCYTECWKLIVKKAPMNIRMLRRLHSCDLVIDITQGDSFTDIYGRDRFLRLTVIKEIVVKMGIPLILGPQTYGPFLDESVRIRAKDIIEKASVVISRDFESKEYIASFCNKTVKVTTDLAFGLQFDKAKHINNNLIRVGINPSGLLVSQKTEGTNLQTSLKVNYDEYIQRMIQMLSQNPQYEVHLIPHVGDDAVKLFKDYPNVICHQAFSTPIDAKNCIAEMDVFIGSRMHAAIGAFSAGVATIPVAYSRKFSGLFNNIGYPYVVDLTEMTTQDALDKTLKLVEQYDCLQHKVSTCLKEVMEKHDSLKEILRETLSEVVL